MHETHNRAYTDNLWTEIERLNWVLNEILVYALKQIISLSISRFSFY
jgi:hypothetical protein